MEIKFGTSGWRGIISDEFTFENVEIVTQAICDYIKEQHQTRDSRPATVVVGYDTRFFSEKFAEITSAVIAANGLQALLTKRDTPTPTIAFEILRRKASGGINFTASHNPSQYNGIKFSPAWGGPALPETTRTIEENCKKYLVQPHLVKKMPFAEALKKRRILMIDPRPQYLQKLRKIVDLPEIRKAHLKIGVDVLYGTGREYLDDLLKEAGVKVHLLHYWRDVLFGGRPPEPAYENLPELVHIVKKEKCHLGLGTDGDADRFGIIDEQGNYIQPGHVIALLLDHLQKTRKWHGVVARSVMTTNFIDAVAQKHGVTVRETPVGFKYIGDILVKEGLIIGGEESGGLTIHGHVPEKDGILACLLVAEMIAYRKKPLSRILADLHKEVGTFVFERVNFHVTTGRMAELKQTLKNNPPEHIAGIKVQKIVTLDGFKFILEDGSWVGLRLSGTEPVVRYYAEANSKPKLQKLINAGKKLVNRK
ncbi:MAG: phosphoglucomutase/phosphomannomutase family protein [bacterium]|nr:phosphoglucomutase/phosphomannomutase family protein [bacterium]MDD5353864.1 phosphoglucomutase/phosphomannomutase family protein [bacterium]MDD5756163.1 phosphoglucomutase/phosphomannomutase family protein [bacterium]